MKEIQGSLLWFSRSSCLPLPSHILNSVQRSPLKFHAQADANFGLCEGYPSRGRPHPD